MTPTPKKKKNLIMILIIIIIVITLFLVNSINNDFYSPVNFCIQQYTDAKYEADMYFTKINFETSCKILNCMNNMNYNMSIKQGQLYADCLSTGVK